jgi:hypothetical protein
MGAIIKGKSRFNFENLFNRWTHDTRKSNAILVDSYAMKTTILKRILARRYLQLAVALLVSKSAFGLPIGFGYNQGDMRFSEVQDDDYIVYFDQRTPGDGALALKSLAAATPHLERWLEVERTRKLVVNMSSESDNASFANFVTDSIELQTLGQGSRDLAWHELTHTLMYQHLNNWFGPAGALVHLPWMEAWFLEGLSEATSVSLGSATQAAIERHQALHDAFPTWDRIHSLYTSGPFSFRGYATSGAFVSWILRKYDASKLAPSLRKFRRDTMPWWWPWALTPFNKFWPMDSMLEEWTGLRGEQLYELYKKEAKARWSKQDSNLQLYAGISGKDRVRSRSSLAFRSDSDGLWVGQTSNDKYVSVSKKKSIPIASADNVMTASVDFIQAKNITAYVTDYWPREGEDRKAIVIKSKVKRTILKRDVSWISQVWLTEGHVYWLESELEVTQLCHAPLSNLKKENVKCPIATRPPESLYALGEKRHASTNAVEQIYLRKTRQALTGDRHDLVTVSTGSPSSSLSPLIWQQGGRPQSLAWTSSGLWMLVSDRSFYYLRRYSTDGTCTGSQRISDLAVRILNSSKDLPWLVVWDGENHTAVDPDSLDPKHKGSLESNCRKLDDHVSPLLVASSSKSIVSFNEAMQASSTWTENASPLLISSTSDNDLYSEDVSSKDASWRGRPIFAFPWIGADDAFGPQIGIVSVPLMDHLQNETVRATVLIGMYSGFPYQELALTETRFTPTWNVALFRAQTYNGLFRNKETKLLESSFLDEKGGRIDGSLTQRWKSLQLNYQWGTKVAHAAPYVGRYFRVGSYNEVYASLMSTVRLASDWYFVAGTQARSTPKALNKSFEYDVVGGQVSLIRNIGLGQAEAGIEAERTRGPKRKDLQEMYLPLKTFVPGSGGGYNKNSFALTADQGLFSPVFGENQARAKLNVTHPIIDSVDKFAGLIYIDRLDASAFLNHGGAWSRSLAPDASDLQTAHGYNVDLLMDNKGVRFNLGVGAGQVIGHSWQIYSTAGFDALF